MPAESAAPATSNVTRSATPASRGALARGGDRVGVVVDPDEARGRERLRHQDRRGAVAAADVGDERAGLELLDDAVERRQPLGHAGTSR